MEVPDNQRNSSEPLRGDDATPLKNPEVADPIRALGTDLRLLVRELGVFAQIHVDRARLAVRSTVQQIIAGLVVLAVVTVFLVFSALRLLDGVRGAILAAFHSPWIADLAAGAGGCLFVIAFVWLRERAATRRSREELIRKYPVDAPPSVESPPNAPV